MPTGGLVRASCSLSHAATDPVAEFRLRAPTTAVGPVRVSARTPPSSRMLRNMVRCVCVRVRTYTRACCRVVGGSCEGMERKTRVKWRMKFGCLSPLD